jgi:Xaa-Pro aminopeptidase/Xaa-Pro dipeptidase
MPLATAPAPSSAQRAAWRAADHAARPARLERLRARLAEDGLDAYFGTRPENSRYLTGFELGDGEEKVSGSSGRFLVSADETVVLADSRYRLQAIEQCPTTRVEAIVGDVDVRWRELLDTLRPMSGGTETGRVRRVAVEAAFVSHGLWTRLAEADPSVELVPVVGWVEAQRAVKEPAELARIAAACAIADRALEDTIADIRPGVPEHDLALALEWRIRTGGAEALAFDVACLSGPRAALPHGSPGPRPVAEGEVLLFDFGAQVEGYRSDMTRTLFVDEPSAHDLALYEIVASAQRAALDALEDALAAGQPVAVKAIDAAARSVIDAAGHLAHFGHGLGHGIGLATHELPSLGRLVDGTLPSPTVFSVEPGIYLDGVTGIRIEDLVAYDADAARLELLTRFPRGVTVVGA